MLNAKKFFNKKRITLMVASAVILLFLILVTATGWVHNTTICHDCDGCICEHSCYTCQDGTITCPECKDLIDKSGCETCSGTGKITCPECDGTKTVTYGYTEFNCDEHKKIICPVCHDDSEAVQNCSKCNGTGKYTCIESVDFELVKNVDGKDVMLALDKKGNWIKCETCGGAGEVIGSFWALLPPIIAIGLALITKEVFSSLFIGLLSGAILAADFAPLKTMDHVINTGLIDAVSGTAGLFVFLIELGILVC